MSQEVARLEELLARVQRNAALPRNASAAFAAAPAAAPSAPVAPAPAAAPAFSAPEVAFDPEPLQPVFEAPLPYPPVGDHEARQVQPASLDQSVDDMLLADPFPSVAPSPPAAQSLTDMLDEAPHVPVSAHQVAPGEDISGVMNRSDLADEPPEELLEDDIVEMSPGEAEADAQAGSNLHDLNFDDEELSGNAHRDVPSDEPPASSSRHKVAGTMDEALARAAAEQIQHDEGREVPLKTPPPESGPQAAMALPVGIHAPLAPDIEELLEADILPVGGVNAAHPTTEQLGQTIDLEEARGPHLELDSALAAPAARHEEHNEELEVTLPRREFGGGYQHDLMPPPEARQELDAHRQRFGEEAIPPPPESLAQYPSQQPAPSTGGFAPQIVPSSVSTDSYSENISTVTVDAPPNAEFAPELLVRSEIAAGPVAKFIRVEPSRPNTFLELLDASLVLGSN